MTAIIQNRPIFREVAATKRDYLTFGGAIGSAGVIQNTDKVLEAQGWGAGLELYDELEQDPRVRAVLRTKYEAVIGMPWSVEPGKRKGSTRKIDRMAADCVRDQIEALGTADYPLKNELEAKGFDSVCLGLLDAILKGFAVGEVMWNIDGKEVVCTEIRIRAQDRFRFAIDNIKGLELRLITATSYSGQPIPDRKFVVHRYGVKPNKPSGSGLGSSIFYPCLFRRQLNQFALIYADKFGSPTPYGEYDPNDENAKDELVAALDAITQGTSITITHGTKLQLLEAMRSGGNPYRELIEMYGDQIAEAVLGQTGTVNQSGSGGSRARDEVGDGVRKEGRQFDSDDLSDTFNRSVIPWISWYNYPDAASPRLWRVPPEDKRAALEDRKLRAETDAIVASIVGRPPSAEYIRANYGDGWDINNPVDSLVMVDE